MYDEKELVMSNAKAEGTTEQKLERRGEFVFGTRMRNDALILLGTETERCTVTAAMGPTQKSFRSLALFTFSFETCSRLTKEVF